MAEKQVKLKITSAIAIDGEIVTSGTVVTVAEGLAKNLLQRGRAELATAGGEKTVAELKVIAEELDIDGAANMKKGELIEAIETAQSE